MIGSYLRIGAALVGIAAGVVSVIRDEKEEVNKDEIIENLAEKYNELVESINNGTLDLDGLQDVEEPEEVEDEEDEKESDDEYNELASDDANIEYYPRKFIGEYEAVNNRIQNLYTDIENCNDGEILFEEDELLEELNSAAAMLATAYQSRYINGISTYVGLIQSKIVDIRRISNYDSSVKRNKNSLIVEIGVLLESANKLNKCLQLNREQIKSEVESSDGDNFIVPVHHKS